MQRNISNQDDFVEESIEPATRHGLAGWGTDRLPDA